MRPARLLIGFLALSLFLLPGLTAQEKKKKDTAADKADAEKPAKTAKKKEEKFEHGPVLKTKIVSMRPKSSHDFTIELSVPDPKQQAQMAQQQAQLQLWQMQQMQQLAMTTNPQQYAQRMQSYKVQLAQRQQQMARQQAQGFGYTKKPYDVRAVENCKVRIMYPPVQYDDNGKLKKWTKKELAALKGNSKLPGYESSFESLKVGQDVEVYLSKQYGSPKAKWTGGTRQKKKKADEDPPEPMPEQRPDIVMIVIHGEPKGK
jgi:FtsZ-interacting cell division protein ZipA